jgi:hypothetical protein
MAVKSRGPGGRGGVSGYGIDSITKFIISKFIITEFILNEITHNILHVTKFICNKFYT